MLYYADIKEFEKLPGFEIEKIEFFDMLPNNWTYPEIQPKLIEKVNQVITLNTENN
jgi:8-oxo-dGTP diphosphatase